MKSMGDNFARIIISKKFLLLYGDDKMEASTTKVSSKGQVVIPANVRKAANLRKGEKILAIAIDDTIVLKKIVDKSFEETMEPVWSRVRKLGLAEENINAIIEEARSQVVLDANVWISALLWGGKPAEIVKAAEQGKVCLIISEEIIEEISQVLSYPKLKKVYEAEGLPASGTNRGSS